jgi:hypothetical protein
MSSVSETGDSYARDTLGLRPPVLHPRSPALVQVLG